MSKRRSYSDEFKREAVYGELLVCHNFGLLRSLVMV
jgi:transposase-like protein